MTTLVRTHPTVTLSRVQTAVAGEKGAESPEELPGPSCRRVATAFGILAGAAFAGAGLVVLFAWLFVRLSWPHVEPLGNPQFGINFDCHHAEYLILEDPAKGEAGYVSDTRPGRAEWCAQTLGALLDETGAKYVRISIEWSYIEPAPGQYRFDTVDALLAEAGRHRAKVLLGIGVKAQRHPEFYIPGWVLDRAHLSSNEVISDDAYLREHALEMIAAVVQHTQSSPAIDSWGADNEPYVPSARANNWTLSREFVRQEVAAIHANDPQRRPVSINHAQHFVFDRRWKNALADGDVLAASLYPFRNYNLLGRERVVPILEIGPFAPNYAAQARAAHDEGKQFWITEMQAEPWYDGDMRILSPTNPSPNLTPSRFEKNIEYARRSGADRVYLWGAEWWLYQQQHFGDSTWINLARAALSR